jgi:hypothetical protein
MSLEGEKCLELILLDGSNYESWCISILNNIEAFNPYLLSIVDSSICPPNITWANLSEEERKCLKLNAQAICLLTQSLSPNVEALILKEHGIPMDAHLLWKYIKEKFSETTTVQDSREADCLTKLIRLVLKTGQTGMAKSAGPRLQRKKCHQSNQYSTSQNSSLPSTSHGKCLMAKGKQEKKPPRVESEEEEDKDDLELDKLSKKYIIKIKRLIERNEEQECNLNNKKSISLARLKS